MATIKSGANTTNANVTNRTIREIRTTHGSLLGIDPTATAYLQGRPVGEDYVVRENDYIEFSKPAGQKGLFSQFASAA